MVSIERVTSTNSLWFFVEKKNWHGDSRSVSRVIVTRPFWRFRGKRGCFLMRSILIHRRDHERIVRSRKWISDARILRNFEKLGSCQFEWKWAYVKFEKCWTDPAEAPLASYSRKNILIRWLNHAKTRAAFRETNGIGLWESLHIEVRRILGKRAQGDEFFCESGARFKFAKSSMKHRLT